MGKWLQNTERPWIVEDEDGVRIAECDGEGAAERIVTEHNRVFSSGRLAGVDWNPDGCSEGEVMISIITTAAELRAGPIEWRMTNNGGDERCV